MGTLFCIALKPSDPYSKPLSCFLTPHGLYRVATGCKHSAGGFRHLSVSMKDRSAAKSYVGRTPASILTSAGARLHRLSSGICCAVSCHPLPHWNRKPDLTCWTQDPVGSSSSVEQRVLISLMETLCEGNFALQQIFKKLPLSHSRDGWGVESRLELPNPGAFQCLLAGGNRMLAGGNSLSSLSKLDMSTAVQYVKLTSTTNRTAEVRRSLVRCGVV